MSAIATMGATDKPVEFEVLFEYLIHFIPIEVAGTLGIPQFREGSQHPLRGCRIFELSGSIMMEFVGQEGTPAPSNAGGVLYAASAS